MALSFAQRDLVVATHGRGLWVVPVGPLEEMSDTHLDWGSRPYVAPNPPRGAVIVYYLKDVQSDGVKLAIVAPAGDTIRHLTGPGYPGVNRVTWDLTRDKPRPRELGGPTSREDLKQEEPGEY